MPANITPTQAKRALALVTDLELAAAAPPYARLIAWSTLKIMRRERIEAQATFRHQPGGAA